MRNPTRWMDNLQRSGFVVGFLHFIRNDKNVWNLIPSLLEPCPPLQYPIAITTNLSINTCLPWLSNRKLWYGIAYGHSLFASSQGHKYIWRNRNPQNQYIVSVMHKSCTAFPTKKSLGPFSFPYSLTPKFLAFPRTIGGLITVAQLQHLQESQLL